MSGTFRALTPFGYAWAEAGAGVIHWWVVPSLIHTVLLPWRWMVARFWLYLPPLGTHPGAHDRLVHREDEVSARRRAEAGCRT